MAERKFLNNLSFNEVVKQYSDTVTGVCIMRLRNYADAEDCYQNVFYKLYYKSPEFYDEEHLKAWLIRTAMNECTSYMRKNRRQLLFDAEPVEEIFKDDSDSRDISWALARVPVKYRDVLYLHYCCQYRISEISEILKIKEGTIKSLLKRGRDILKSIYGGEKS